MTFTINGKSFESQEEFTRFGRGCATKLPTPIDILRVDEEIKANKSKRRMFKHLTIEVMFCHFTYGAQGTIHKKQRVKQIELLNNAFKGANIQFHYKENNVRFVDNFNWYKMGHGSKSEREAKSEHARDPHKYLNFYTGGLQAGLLGWATFPYELAGNQMMDGVVLLDESLPGGSAKPYHLGMTAVHEVGHWLGLFHTFQGGCDGIGDHVHDTPAHDSPNYGKPKDGLSNNACNPEEFAPIHNYMNYVDDEWMNELTSAQEKRIKEQVMMYRTGLINS